MKQPKQEVCPDCVNGKVGVSGLKGYADYIEKDCPTCHGTGLKPEHKGCHDCEYEKGDIGCVQIICPHQIESDPKQETAGMGEPVFYQSNETGTSYRVTGKPDSKLRDKIAKVQRCLRNCNLYPFLCRKFSKCRIKCDLVDYEMSDQITALLPDEAEIRKQERVATLDWLEYNAPEFVRQRFQDGVDVR